MYIYAYRSLGGCFPKREIQFDLRVRGEARVNLGHISSPAPLLLLLLLWVAAAAGGVACCWWWRGLPLLLAAWLAAGGGVACRCCWRCGLLLPWLAAGCCRVLLGAAGCCWGPTLGTLLTVCQHGADAALTYADLC